MPDPTPRTRACELNRSTADAVATATNRTYANWPGNVTFASPMFLNPKTLAELANAVLKAEGAGHHIRAFGSKWSFSDAASASTAGSGPGAMIVTEQLKKSLNSQLPSLLKGGVDPTYLCHVEAGMKANDLMAYLAAKNQNIEAGGASGQSIAGMMSTSTHSADSQVQPFVDHVQAIHLVAAGGVEHWIERAAPITDPSKLTDVYSCLAPGNIHYDTALFNAVLVAAGSMGVIYSVIIRTVPQFALRQHRVVTTWQALIQVDPLLSGVINGSYMASRHFGADINVLEPPPIMSEPFSPNTFSQIVVNPYPFYGNDATLTPRQQIHIGQHECIVTNRVTVPIPAQRPGPPPSLNLETLGTGLGTAALDALGRGPDYPQNAVRFKGLSDIYAHEPDVTRKAAALIDMLAENYQPGTISAAIRYVLSQILPLPDRVDVNLTEVIGWGGEIRSFCVEAAFPVPAAMVFVAQVFVLIQMYAARQPHVYVGGYLALRIVGQKTEALLGMQRWSPTCHVEYMGIAGTKSIDEFVDDLQKLAIAAGGVLHLGLQNNKMTAADLLKAFGRTNVEQFRRARGLLSQDGALKSFDNSFTDRLGLSAL
jgi:FAD/FMN-containing dehydrogenase